MPANNPELDQPTMTLDEARKTMWLQSNHRPLGELLDEGYLNQTRLEWAAQKAYNPKLRKAAKVLLDCLFNSTKPDKASIEQPRLAESMPESAFELDISLEEARSTPWPFSPYKNEAMGPLVETKQLSLKDLGYSIEHAWDDRVRRASVALLLVRLKQVLKEQPPTAGFLRVISGGRSFAERWQLVLAMLQGTLLGALLGICIGNLLFSPPPSAENSQQLSQALTTPSGIVALIVVIVGAVGFLAAFFALLDWIIRRFQKAMENYRAGQEGEERTVEVMLQALDGNWTLFRNVTLPGRNRGDLDAVLVGRSGVWVFEIKTLHGEYRNNGDKWEYRHGRQWKAARANPSLQANKNAKRLANFLKADDVKQWVTGIVVWAGSISPHVENPLVGVWTIDRLADELGNLGGNRPIPDSQREAILEKLTKLCDPGDKTNRAD